jgi:hypothetical protein
MEPTRESTFTPRVILGIVAGIAFSLLLIYLKSGYQFAPILGLLVAMSIANLNQPGEFAMLGFASGSLSGLFLGLSIYLNSNRLNPTPVGIALALLVGAVISGLICAVYGYVIGKILSYYKQGRGPFF